MLGCDLTIILVILPVSVYPFTEQTAESNLTQSLWSLLVLVL